MRPPSSDITAPVNARGERRTSQSLLRSPPKMLTLCSARAGGARFADDQRQSPASRRRREGHRSAGGVKAEERKRALTPASTMAGGQTFKPSSISPIPRPTPMRISRRKRLQGRRRAMLADQRGAATQSNAWRRRSLTAVAILLRSEAPDFGGLSGLAYGEREDKIDLSSAIVGADSHCCPW